MNTNKDQVPQCDKTAVIPSFSNTSTVVKIEHAGELAYTLERKDNTYFDQSGKQILVGDLLKVFHFKSRNRNYYMYHVVVMEDAGESFPVMALKAHYADKSHYILYAVANSQRVYLSAKIIGMKDWDTKRQTIKVI